MKIKYLDSEQAWLYVARQFLRFHETGVPNVISQSGLCMAVHTLRRMRVITWATEREMLDAIKKLMARLGVEAYLAGFNPEAALTRANIAFQFHTASRQFAFIRG